MGVTDPSLKKALQEGYNYEKSGARFQTTLAVPEILKAF